MNSRIFFSLGTFAGVNTVSNRFQPWRVLLMPTVQTSTAWRSAADTRAAINTRPLVRDSQFVMVVYSDGINSKPRD